MNTQIDLKLKIRPGIFAHGEIDDGTKRLVEQIEQLPKRSVVADLGSGSGVVGMMAAKINPRSHVHLLDSDIRAVELARENVKLNDLKNVEVYLSDLFSAVGDRTYHQILSNPPQSLGNQFLAEIAQACQRHLKPGGKVFWVVKRNLKPFVQRLFEKCFINSTMVAGNRSYIVMKGERSDEE